jgi:hypothetical protein
MKRISILSLAVLATASLSAAQGEMPGSGKRGGPGGPGGRPPGPGLVEPVEGDRIAWYGTWEQAKAEAKKCGKPIMLVSAAPHCHHISGVW